MRKKVMKIGVIGLGTRVSFLIAEEFKEEKDFFKIVAVTDINHEKVMDTIFKAPDFYAKDVQLYTDADAMLDAEDLDGVMIGTRCSLHTEMAVKVIRRGIPLFLEKPVSTNLEDIKRLNAARKQYNPKVVVSFPLRTSNMIRLVKDMIDAGKIGKVESVQAFNDVPYARVYQREWYRDVSETGGLWLQKATHDLDYINYIVGGRPVKICAMTSKTLFTGDMPENQVCGECSRYETCPESPKIIRTVYGQEAPDTYQCCFSPGNGNQDAGSAIIRYDSGIFVSYNQNFIARNRSERRGARFYGYKGTLAFDFDRSEITFYSHTLDVVEKHNLAASRGSHFGGDIYLMRRFYDMMAGKEVDSMLEDGLKSALLCWMAKESSSREEYLEIPELDNV